MSHADIPHAHSVTDRISHKQVKLSIADIDGVLRGKFVSAEKALSMLRGDQTLQFCSVIFGWDVADNLYDNGKFAGWHTGYPDITAKLGMHSSPPCRPCLSPLPPPPHIRGALSPPCPWSLACASGRGALTRTADLSSYRELPWENNKPFFMLDFVQDDDHTKPLDVCPRCGTPLVFFSIAIIADHGKDVC